MPTPSANAADVTYVTMMITHHRQALDMSVLAPARASSDQLRGLAARIKDSQEPEITVMINWLTSVGAKPPEYHPGRHENMPGMATPQQMDSLRAARGKDFDRTFLQLMITHHQGAITMAQRELAGGSHLLAQQMSRDVIATQSAEIGRMKSLLSQL